MAAEPKTNEMTKELLTTILEGLRSQLELKRMNTSESLAELKAFVMEHQGSDPLLFPVKPKENPWHSKSKCLII